MLSSLPRLIPAVATHDGQPIAPICVEHGGNRYAIHLVEYVPPDFHGPVVVQLRLEPLTITLNGKSGVLVSEASALGFKPNSLTWGHAAFQSSRTEGEFSVVMPESGMPADAMPLNKLLERIEWINRLALASGATHCGRVSLSASNALFVGTCPAGVVFSYRDLEKSGDYLRLGFLDYSTLRFTPECYFTEADPEIQALIGSEVSAMQAKEGQLMQISTSGQTVMLGSQKAKATSGDVVQLPASLPSTDDTIKRRN